jgi:predicted amidophosphoribosyltransferase
MSSNTRWLNGKKIVSGECSACGEVLPWDRKSTLCLECENEIKHGTIPPPTTLMHDAGGGTRVVRKGTEMS